MIYNTTSTASAFIIRFQYQKYFKVCNKFEYIRKALSTVQVTVQHCFMSTTVTRLDNLLVVRILVGKLE